MIQILLEILRGKSIKIFLPLLFFFLLIALFNIGLFKTETFVITSRAALSELPDEASVKEKSISLEQIRRFTNVKIDFNFLKSEEFTSLVINGDIPIKPQAEGRDNPFIPY